MFNHLPFSVSGDYFRLIILLTLVFLSSCGRDSVYEENKDLEEQVWLVDSTLEFTFKITDAEERYDIYYNLRNTNAYPYQNLYISSALKDASGEEIFSDLANLTLFDPKTGKPYGNGLGDIFSHQFKVISAYQFADTGTYRLNMQQFMRRDTLPDIVSVGISIKEAAVED